MADGADSDRLAHVGADRIAPAQSMGDVPGSLVEYYCACDPGREVEKEPLDQPLGRRRELGTGAWRKICCACGWRTRLRVGTLHRCQVAVVYSGDRCGNTGTRTCCRLALVERAVPCRHRQVGRELRAHTIQLTARDRHDHAQCGI